MFSTFLSSSNGITASHDFRSILLNNNGDHEIKLRNMNKRCIVTTAVVPLTSSRELAVKDQRSLLLSGSLTYCRGNSLKDNQCTWIWPQQIGIIKSIEHWAEEKVLPLLKPVETCWQPHDFLPHSSNDTFMDEVRELKQRASQLPDDYIVCLVGDMITEEALPTYQSVFNTFEGVRDTTGSSPTPWGVWVRAWTAEENRHGDLLNKYLYLSGRVDMRMVEKTTQYLIGAGMNAQIDNSPYNGFIYTSFQERATFISHGNTARLAKEHGDNLLATICGIIASDEKRHEIAYTKIVGKLFEVDADGAMLAFADMMRKKITMPAHLMFDGENPHLFGDYATVAQRCNVYTAKDYVDIMEHLIATWKVDSLRNLSSEALEAQEYVCNLPSRMRRISEKAHDRSSRKSSQLYGAQNRDRNFSWIFHRSVEM